MLTQSTPTFIAAEIIPAGARVKLVAGSGIRVELADKADKEIGTAILHSGKDSYAAESAVGVKLNQEAGTRTCIAVSAIAEGAVIKRADNGKVDDAGTGSVYGRAMEDAGIGDAFEALYMEPEPIQVTLTSTDGTMAAAADDAATKAEGEKIGDDLRAIHAALVTAGILIP